MPERTAQRTYRESELPTWLRRVSRDWERNFRPQELEYGRALYKAGCVRGIELNKDDAFITAKLEDGSEPFCIIDFKNDEFLYIPPTTDDFLYGALKVAGFYEIEEFVIDRAAELNISANDVLADSSESTQAAAQPDTGGNVGAETPQARLGAESAAEAARQLSLNFSSKRKGLVFEVFWRDGEKRVRAFGDKSPSVEELSPEESGSLMRLVTLSRKAGFRFDDNAFVLSDISKISPFLRSTMSEWRKYWTIRKDRFVDLLSLGERKIMLSARAKSVSSSDDFDIEWLPTVDGKAVNRDDISRIFNGKSTVQILPEYGIISISRADSDFVKNVERARDFGFESGKIPKYMLLSLSDFGGNLMLSDDLKEWVDTLVAKPAEVGFSEME